jgi:predicted TIM-barrel fold metal-dependent hydrolase
MPDEMIFDAHFHIVDERFPLVPNQGYLPPPFTVADYRRRCKELGLAIAGGAVVSGSFQGFDQDYLLAALRTLGPGFVGVTQLPATAADKEILALHEAGVRAVRFNLFRGGSERIEHLKSFGSRVYDLCGWHVELYVAASRLGELAPVITTLPRVSIDHLGLTRAGFDQLVALVERGVKVKATGFSRGDLDVASAVATVAAANPGSLMFGTDLPCTRAPRAFSGDDLQLILDTLDPNLHAAVLCENARHFYRLEPAAAARGADEKPTTNP